MKQLLVIVLLTCSGFLCAMNKSVSIKHICENYTLKELSKTLVDGVENNEYQDVSRLLTSVSKDQLNEKIRNKAGCTLIEIACEKGYEKLAVLLLEHGADPNIYANEQNRSPLHYSISNGFSLETIKLFVKSRTNLNAETKSNKLTPLDRVLFKRDCSMASYLIQQGALANLYLKEEKEPLLEPIKQGNLDLIKFFLENGARVNDHNDNREGVIFFTVSATLRKGEEKVIEMINCFAEYGAKVNMGKKTNKKTPLHCAVIGDYDDVVKTLIGLGANTNLKDSMGKVPADYAQNHEMKEIFDQVKALAESMRENYFTYAWYLVSQNDYLRTALWMHVNSRKLFENLCDKIISLKECNALLATGMGTKKIIDNKKDFIDEIFVVNSPKVIRRLLSLGVVPSSDAILYKKDPKRVHGLHEFYLRAQSKNIKGDIQLFYQ